MKLAIVLLFCVVSSGNTNFPGTVNINFDAYPTSDICNQQVGFLQENRRTLWALEMLDSWGNFPPSGSFSGNRFDFGNFDQCIELRSDPSPVGVVVGQHCTLLVPHQRYANEISAKFMPPSRK